MTAPAEPTRAPVLGEPLPVELMNTIWADRGGVHDALRTEAEVLAWLRAVGPRLVEHASGVATWLDSDPPVDLDQAATELRRLRDALRRLAAETTQDPRPAAAAAISDRDRALEIVNQVAAVAPAWPAVTWPVGHQPMRTLQVSQPAGSAIASMLATEFIGLLATGSPPELRACLAPGCVLYFAKDHNRREWCSPACGNRARAARHYRRRKATSG